MGRLNREVESDTAMLSIYEYDYGYKPYNKLEMDKSEIILKDVKDSSYTLLRRRRQYCIITGDIKVQTKQNNR